MRKIIGTIGATLAIVVLATSAAPAGAQSTAAAPYSPAGPASHSADLSLSQRAHDGASRLLRNDGLVAVPSDAPESLRAMRRDVEPPESVSGLAQVDSGWELDVDVVEVRRVPDTASLLATYRVTTDDSGDIAGYERMRRFNRGQAD
jgi:hypothetical protein